MLNKIVNMIVNGASAKEVVEMVERAYSKHEITTRMYELCINRIADEFGIDAIIY